MVINFIQVYNKSEPIPQLGMGSDFALFINAFI